MLLRLPRWGWPARWYDEFADGYGRSLADDPVTIAIAELRLVAATLLRLRAGRADAAAMPEASGAWRSGGATRQRRCGPPCDGGAVDRCPGRRRARAVRSPR